MAALSITAAVGISPASAQVQVIEGNFGTSVEEVLGNTPTWDRPVLSFYGTPGLIDMPSGHMMKDGDVTLSSSYFRGSFRNTMTFQLSPRISGSFRYSEIDDYFSYLAGPGNKSLYDRSFDVSALLVEESDSWPAISIGLRDFGGTGIYGGEYVAASKTFNRMRVTGGIGWGRLGSYNSFANPLGILSDSLKSRPGRTAQIADTGQLDFGNWFRGDAAFFGGLQYQVSDKLVLTAEYSSDDYADEVSRQDFFEPQTPLNFGATYRFDNGTDLSAAYLYGNQLGVMLSYTFNPKEVPYPGGVETRVPPIRPRSELAALGWGAGDLSGEAARERLRKGLDGQGIVLETYERVSPTTVQVHVVNSGFDTASQALGRVGRIMANTLPPEIETFIIVPVALGMPLSAVTMQRRDLEEQEFAYDGAWGMYSRVGIEDAAEQPERLTHALPSTYPYFTYDLGAYLDTSYFDPDQPVRADLGLQLDLGVMPLPGLALTTSLRYPLIGNLDDATRRSNSILPHVRSDAVLYDINSDVRVEHMTAEYFLRPGQDLYGRVTAGYLEKMYAGVSSELLWKPVTGPLALGLEVNYARQRDYDVLFDMKDYDIVTGHASAYYDWGNGFLTQLDVGRYLAGDWGSTFTLTREFNNGFRIGAFATLTDVSFDDFGEGSFDKGIMFWIPTSRVSGEPDRGGFGQTIRPVQRDGGARLGVRNRLYDVTRGYHDPELQEDWGRFWR